MKMFAIVLAVLVSVPLVARAVTPDQIDATPRLYNGQHVQVTGRVTDIQVERLSNGKAYTLFSLCATGCVGAFVVGAPALVAGQMITVHGTYYGLRNRGAYTIRHAVEVDAGSL